MNKCVFVAVAITLVNCQSTAKTHPTQQTQSDPENYQEEAYQIGQQEEEYGGQTRTKTQPQ
ncbi:MAG: hypothetical protein ABI262_08845 [Microcoleus sp.]|jgi:hypothetical protein